MKKMLGEKLMKVRMRYFIYFIVILIFSTVIPKLVTNSKYFSSVNMESGISIGAMIFNIKQADGQPNPYELNKGEEITVSYKISNKDDDNNINKMDLKYYLKVVDSAGGEVLPIQYMLEGYQYIQEESINKGYGEISLAYDGQTIEEKVLNIKIACPADYAGDENLNYKVKIIAEGISNTEFSAEEVADLNIHINGLQVQNPEPENTEEPQQENTVTDNTAASNNETNTTENNTTNQANTENTTTPNNTTDTTENNNSSETPTNQQVQESENQNTETSGESESQEPVPETNNSEENSNNDG